MLTEKDLAERWAVSPVTLKMQRHRRVGAPYVKLPTGSVRYPLAEVEKIEQEGLVMTR